MEQQSGTAERKRGRKRREKQTLILVGTGCPYVAPSTGKTYRLTIQTRINLGICINSMEGSD